MADPVDIADIIRAAKPVIIIIAASEKSWYSVGVICGGLGLRNDIPVVGSPPGFCVSMPFHTASVTDYHLRSKPV